LLPEEIALPAAESDGTAAKASLVGAKIVRFEPASPRAVTRSGTDLRADKRVLRFGWVARKSVRAFCAEAVAAMAARRRET
jgi:hypothetical protein